MSYVPGTAFTLMTKYYCWEKPQRSSTSVGRRNSIFNKNDVLLVIASNVNQEWSLVLSSSGETGWMYGDLTHCTKRMFNTW